jgi:hypothetical protein
MRLVMGFDYKNSPPIEVQKKLKEILQQTGGHLTLSSRALSDVEDAIYPGEQIFAIGEGVLNLDMWLILVTDRRILLLCRGLLFGFKSKTIELEKISAVTSESGRMMTTLIVKEGRFNHEISNIHKDAAITIEKKIKAGLKANEIGLPAETLPEDEHLASLAELVKRREARLIDDEEFDREKAKIMEKYIAG